MLSASLKSLNSYLKYGFIKPFKTSLVNPVIIREVNNTTLTILYPQEALSDAEDVLIVEPGFVPAVFSKAESMFNLCKFEQAMCGFYRGKVSC